ncbi:MAG TPA: hypothetical protein PLZ93_13130 [Nocardioides sp.]|uniref:hypothetical protein n=1 Tax=uncultured Nocardioides sp. TaxID=198441 RepID=UPI00260F7B7B|nr:hypothetical protein [uncultured Nocardioides sp.]HRD64446.1 hypothetical protein [Nocardioides sp.]HRI96553.1 hypothetical protein [Nocardioides sp.]
MTTMAHHEHPVTRAIAAARETFAAVAEVPLWPIGADQATAALDELLKHEAQQAS